MVQANCHPRSIFLAESGVILVLDQWLAELSARNTDQARLYGEASVRAVNDPKP
jgi:hypothetical protein